MYGPALVLSGGAWPEQARKQLQGMTCQEWMETALARSQEMEALRSRLYAADARGGEEAAEEEGGAEEGAGQVRWEQEAVLSRCIVLDVRGRG